MTQVRAILNAPNLSTRSGVRDRAMLHLCFAGGLRVSELVGLQLGSVSLGAAPSIHIVGKGRRERLLPIWRETTRDLRAWIALRGSVNAPELFVNAAGRAMTRDGFEYILAKHARAAVTACPSLEGQKVTPHQLRHSCAMVMLGATRDVRKVAIGSAMLTLERQKFTCGPTSPKSLRRWKRSCHLNYAEADFAQQMR